MSRKSKKIAQRLAEHSSVEGSAEQKSAKKDGVLADLPWMATKAAFFLGGALLFGGAYWVLKNREKVFGASGKKTPKKRSSDKSREETSYDEETAYVSEPLNHSVLQ